MPLKLIEMVDFLLGFFFFFKPRLFKSHINSITSPKGKTYKF